MKKRILSLILTLVMVFTLLPIMSLTVRATEYEKAEILTKEIIGSGNIDEELPEPMSQQMYNTRIPSIDIQTDYVFANGIPIIIRENGNITSIYSAEGELLSGETDIKDKKYIIGGSLSNYTGDTSITMESGTITGRIYGGNYKDTLTGNTNITITNGTVNFVFGGNMFSGVVTGNTNITVSDGIVNGWFYGGGAGHNDAEITEVIGSTNISITGGVFQKNIYGGGAWRGAKVGSSNISITGGTANWIYGGGEEVSNTGDVSIIIDGTASVGNVFAGGAGFGSTDATVTGNASIKMHGGTVGEIYGSGGGYDDQTSIINGAVAVEVSGGVLSYLSAAHYDGATISGDFSLMIDDVSVASGCNLGYYDTSSKTMRNVNLHSKGSTVASNQYYFSAPITGALDIKIEDTFVDIIMDDNILDNATSKSLTYINCGAPSNTWTEYRMDISIQTPGQNPITSFDRFANNKFGTITLANCYFDFNDITNSGQESKISTVTDKLVIDGGAFRCHFLINLYFPTTEFKNNPTLIYSYPVKGLGYGTSSIMFTEVTGKAKLQLMSYDGNPNSNVPSNGNHYCEAVLIPKSANVPFDTFTLQTTDTQTNHFMACEDMNISLEGNPSVEYRRWSISTREACGCRALDAFVHPKVFKFLDLTQTQLFELTDINITNQASTTNGCQFYEHRIEGAKTDYTITSSTTNEATISDNQLTVKGAGKIELDTKTTAGFASSDSKATIYTVLAPTDNFTYKSYNRDDIVLSFYGETPTLDFFIEKGTGPINPSVDPSAYEFVASGNTATLTIKKEYLNKLDFGSTNEFIARFNIGDKGEVYQHDFTVVVSDKEAVNVDVTASKTTGIKYGESVTFTANVSPSDTSVSAIPTGTVQFTVNGSIYGNPQQLVQGKATFTLDESVLQYGSYTIMANYTGDSSFITGQGDTSISVAKADLEVTVTTDKTSYFYGEAVTFDVSTAIASVQSFSLTATQDTVDFYYDYNGTKVKLNDSTVNVQSDKTATFTYNPSVIGEAPKLPKGSNITVTAEYGGSGNLNAQTGSVTFSVTEYNPTETATLSGTVGTNGWYTSNVDIIAPSGFQINADGGTTWSADIICSTEGSTNVTYYLKNITSGAISEQKTVNIKIDKTAPVGTLKSPTGTDVSTSIKGFIELGFIESITAISDKTVTISGGGNTYTAIATSGTIIGSGNSYNVTIPFSAFGITQN